MKLNLESQLEFHIVKGSVIEYIYLPTGKAMTGLVVEENPSEDIRLLNLSTFNLDNFKFKTIDDIKNSKQIKILSVIHPNHLELNRV